MSDAWCADCGEQGHSLNPVWDGKRTRWVCEGCALGYVGDEPMDEEETMPDQNTEGPLLEALADQEHARWSRWMRYMFGSGRTTDDGRWIMPPAKRERWTRQMETPYADLTEPEKESDRAEARNTLALLARFDARTDAVTAATALAALFSEVSACMDNHVAAFAARGKARTLEGAAGDAWAYADGLPSYIDPEFRYSWVQWAAYVLDAVREFDRRLLDAGASEVRG